MRFFSRGESAKFLVLMVFGLREKEPNQGLNIRDRRRRKLKQKKMPRLNRPASHGEIGQMRDSGKKYLENNRKKMMTMKFR